MKVTGLPEMFAGVNKNFISAVVKGTLIMAGDSINLGSLQTMVADSGSYILPTERDVRRATREVSKKWWRSFSYDYVLAVI
jgi:hypothetical protein